jgi:hypothetical protein
MALFSAMSLDIMIHGHALALGFYVWGEQFFQNWILNFLQLRTSEKLRVSSSGMLRHVALARTDILDKHIASIIRVTRIGELGTTSTVTSN